MILLLAAALYWSLTNGKVHNTPIGWTKANLNNLKAAFESHEVAGVAGDIHAYYCEAENGNENIGIVHSNDKSCNSESFGESISVDQGFKVKQFMYF